MIVASCPHCGGENGADESAEGAEMVCATCENVFVFQANPPSKATSTPEQKPESKTARIGSWIFLVLMLAFLGGTIFWAMSLFREDEVPEVVAEQRAENRKLEAERMEEALALRRDVLDRKWDSLFEEKAGSPTKIEIDEKKDVWASLGGVSLNGIAFIDGVKHEFHIGFDRLKSGELVQDQFRINEWEEYKPKPVGDKIDAWVAFQNFVEARLKSPSSAKFPFGGHRDVVHLGDGRYSVKSHVEAQNSFGATVRTNFSGVVANEGGKWILVSLNLEE